MNSNRLLFTVAGGRNYQRHIVRNGKIQQLIQRSGIGKIDDNVRFHGTVCKMAEHRIGLLRLGHNVKTGDNLTVIRSAMQLSSTCPIFP